MELQKTDSVLFDSLHSFRVAFGNLFPFGRLWSILLNSGLYHCLLKFRLCTAKEGGMAVTPSRRIGVPQCAPYLKIQKQGAIGCGVIFLALLSREVFEVWPLGFELSPQ